MIPVECSACGLAPVDLPDGVDPDLFFELDERSNTYHCPTCDALSDDEEWQAEQALKGRDYDSWSRL